MNWFDYDIVLQDAVGKCRSHVYCILSAITNYFINSQWSNTSTFQSAQVPNPQGQQLAGVGMSANRLRIWWLRRGMAKGIWNGHQGLRLSSIGWWNVVADASGSQWPQGQDISGSEHLFAKSEEFDEMWVFCTVSIWLPKRKQVIRNECLQGNHLVNEVALLTSAWRSLTGWWTRLGQQVLRNQIENEHTTKQLYNVHVCPIFANIYYCLLATIGIYW